MIICYVDSPSCENDENKSSGLINSSAAAAAKRKGSFKKWLRSSHRKFTSNSNTRSLIKDNTNAINNQQKYLNLSTNSDIENLKIKVKNFYV